MCMVSRGIVKDDGMGRIDKGEKNECGKIGELVYGYDGRECGKG